MRSGAASASEAGWDQAQGMFSPSDLALEMMSLANRSAFLVICEALFLSLILEITSPMISPKTAAPAPI